MGSEPRSALATFLRAFAKEEFDTGPNSNTAECFGVLSESQVETSYDNLSPPPEGKVLAERGSYLTSPV